MQRKHTVLMAACAQAQVDTVKWLLSFPGLAAMKDEVGLCIFNPSMLSTLSVMRTLVFVYACRRA